MSNFTIKEIARMAGVSPTAVSFVLNNKEGVSEETRKKVTEVIRKTNFKPSINSRRLSLKKSFNISIVMKQSSSPFLDLFYFEIAKGVLEKSKEYGYNVVFTDLSNENNFDLAKIINFEDTDGVIFLQDTETSILNETDKYNIPFVVVDTHSANNNFISINADYELSSYTATRFLIDKGHQDIAFISSSFIPGFYLQTFTGYQRALEETHITVRPSWIQIDATDDLSAYQCMEKILQDPSLPTAVFCAVDFFAIGAMRCVKNHNYVVPNDFSFVGIDDILLSRYIEPPLTTIRIDKVQMGLLAMELLMKIIEGEPVETIIVESDNMIVRNTVIDNK